MSPSLRRSLLWGFLVVVLVVVAGAAVLQRLRRSEPPPVLGQVPGFSLTNRDGRAVELADLAGSPWVADFIFTRCPASCPIMTSRMAALDRKLPEDSEVRLVSVSVDPEHDTPEVLQKYAASFQAPERWLFLTGSRQEIYRLSKDGFKLAVDDSPGEMGVTEEPILHSTRFVLVDGEGRIRGYYNAFSDEDLAKLDQDLAALLD